MNWINRTLLIAILIAPLSCGDGSPIYVPVQTGFDPVSGTPEDGLDRLVIVQDAGARLIFNITRQTVVFQNLHDATARVRAINSVTSQVILNNQNLPRSTDLLTGMSFSEGDTIHIQVWLGAMRVAESYLWTTVPDAENTWQLGG